MHAVASDERWHGMAVLSSEQIRALHEAVVRARLTESRAALLGGIDPGVVDQLSILPNPSAQILSDLRALNAVGALSDGAVPIRTWLENAAAIAGPRDEAQVFSSAMLDAARAIVLAPAPLCPRAPFHVPFLRNPGFVGRDDDLLRLTICCKRAGLSVCGPRRSPAWQVLARRSSPSSSAGGQAKVREV